MTTRSEVRRVTADELQDLLRGVRVFGTGGGGDPKRGAAQIDADKRSGRSYTLIAPEDVEDDALVLSGGFMGHMAVRSSWDSTIAHWEEVYELEQAVRAMERFLGRRADYLVPFELGGGNTIAILSCAARLGVPVVDGDGIGRAAPETQMSSFAAHGIDLVPMTLYDEAGGTVIVERGDLLYPDAVGRFVVTRSGGLVANCHSPMDGVTLRQAVVPHTISESISLGVTIRRLQRGAAGIVDELAAFLGARIHIVGRVEGVEGRTEGGFFFSEARICGNACDEGPSMTLLIKNEVMAGWLDGALLSVFPDHLYLIDPSSGEGLLTRELIAGRDVAVLGRACHQRLREVLDLESARQVFSGRRFGLNVDYEPTEDLLERSREGKNISRPDHTKEEQQ